MPVRRMNRPFDTVPYGIFLISGRSPRALGWTPEAPPESDYGSYRQFDDLSRIKPAPAHRIALGLPGTRFGP